MAEIAKRHSILLAVDNTFLTPVLQKSLERGADISALSTTKYIDGHNATVGGSLATRDEKLLERFRLIRKPSALPKPRLKRGSCCRGSRHCLRG